MYGNQHQFFATFKANAGAIPILAIDPILMCDPFRFKRAPVWDLLYRVSGFIPLLPFIRFLLLEGKRKRKPANRSLKASQIDLSTNYFLTACQEAGMAFAFPTILLVLLLAPSLLLRSYAGEPFNVRQHLCTVSRFSSSLSLCPFFHALLAGTFSRFRAFFPFTVDFLFCSVLSSVLVFLPHFWLFDEILCH